LRIVAPKRLPCWDWLLAIPAAAGQTPRANASTQRFAPGLWRLSLRESSSLRSSGDLTPSAQADPRRAGFATLDWMRIMAGRA